MTTAAAFLLFAEARVDVAILEVGLGGRLDSTNACEPAVTVVTQIELEHTDKLGDTIAAIAGEKAGILKPRVPAVTGELHPDAARVVAARASAVDAPLARLGSEFRVELREARPLTTDFGFEDDGFRCAATLSVAGTHQVANAAVALAAIRRGAFANDVALATRGAAALGEVVLPARAELRPAPKPVLIDGAHTAASAEALGAIVAALAPPVRSLVLSVSAGKDLAPIVSALAPGCRRVVVTRAEPVRSLPTDALAAEVEAVAPAAACVVVDDPADAVRSARGAQGDDELLIVAGSVYMAGIARDLLVPESR